MFGRKDAQELISKIMEGARVAYVTKKKTFVIAGLKFGVEQVAPDEVWITRNGKDAGIRVKRGIPVME